MARSISVKIPTAEVLSMVESKIAEYKEQIENYPARVEAYKADRKAYTKQVADKVADVIANGHNLFDGDYENTISINRSYRGGIEIRVGQNLIGSLADQAPKEPENIDGYNGVTSKLAELEKTVKLLRLTPQETVTSATYNSVLDLL